MRGYCTGSVDGVPGIGEVSGTVRHATAIWKLGPEIYGPEARFQPRRASLICHVCGKRVGVTVRGLYARHKPKLSNNSSRS